MNYAFCGGPLTGDRIVRLVYMDEAGLANPEHEPHVVVSGVIVNADEQLLLLEKYLDALVIEYIPEKHRQNFIFHATELFNGGGPVFDRNIGDWPLEKRLEIADELSTVFGRFDIPIQFGFVERADFPKTFDFPENTRQHHKTVAAHAVAFVQCAMAIERWMVEKTSNEICILVAEDNDHVRKIIKDTQRHYQDSTHYESLTEEERKYFPFTKIKQDPLFEPKKRSSVLQLADYCAYVFKRFLMEDHHYDRFFDPMRPQLALFGEYENLPASR